MSLVYYFWLASLFSAWPLGLVLLPGKENMAMWDSIKRDTHRQTGSQKVTVYRHSMPYDGPFSKWADDSPDHFEGIISLSRIDSINLIAVGCMILKGNWMIHIEVDIPAARDEVWKAWEWKLSLTLAFSCQQHPIKCLTSMSHYSINFKYVWKQIPPTSTMAFTLYCEERLL